MNDRELLELAAKAAALPDLKSGAFGHYRVIGEHEDGKLCMVQWNPLTDDGDALRLAAKLRINVEWVATMGGIDAGVNCWPRGRGDCGLTVNGDDAARCVRRAIVRAAAELGKLPIPSDK